MRRVKEIKEYMDEAFDKVWLMRTHPCDISSIEKERVKNVTWVTARNAIFEQRILETYPDIPEDEYTDWESGYWNGILGALRWVLGDEKNDLDT